MSLSYKKSYYQSTHHIGQGQYEAEFEYVSIEEAEKLLRIATQLQAERDKAVEALTFEKASAASWRSAERMSRKAIEVKDAALKAAQRVFVQYAELHEAKGTEDGHLKAVKNQRHADRIDDALRSIAQTGGTE